MILFGDKGMEALRRLVAQSRHAADIAEEIVRKADTLCLSEPLAYVLDPQRGTLLETSRAVGERVYTLGLAWAVTGHTPFRRRIVAELLSASAFPDWHRQHFLDTAEMAAAVAIGFAWSKPVMTASERQAILSGLLRNGLDPGLRSLQGGSGWTSAGTNWTLVCSGGLIVAAAVARTDMPEPCDAILDLALPGLQRGLRGFDDEGGWSEGATYGEYGARYAILALETLRDTGLAARIPAEAQRLAPHWRFLRAMVGSSGRAFNAGDGLETQQRSPVAGWFARNAQEADAAAWQWEVDGPHHPFDLIWYTAPPARTKLVHRPSRQIFPAGYATLRNGETYIAVIGGRNDTNHAHLDLGSFVLDMQGERIICDPGRGDYAAPGYFDPSRRFTHFPTQTRAHNVAFAGEQAVAAEALFIRDPEDEARLAMDITDPAAPFHHLRGIHLDETAATIADFLLPKTSLTHDIMWQCHTDQPAEIVDGAVRLGDPVRLIHARLLSPPGSALTLAPLAAAAEAFPGLQRLIAEFNVPPDGLLIACAFSSSASSRMPVGFPDWLVHVARDRWPEAAALKRSRND